MGWARRLACAVGGRSMRRQSGLRVQSGRCECTAAVASARHGLRVHPLWRAWARRLSEAPIRGRLVAYGLRRVPAAAYAAARAGPRRPAAGPADSGLPRDCASVTPASQRGASRTQPPFRRGSLQRRVLQCAGALALVTGPGEAPRQKEKSEGGSPPKVGDMNLLSQPCRQEMRASGCPHPRWQGGGAHAPRPSAVAPFRSGWSASTRCPTGSAPRPRPATGSRRAVAV